MTQRVHNLTKWKFLQEGETLWFKNPRQRVVVLEVNAPGECCLYVTMNKEDLLRDPERIADNEAGRVRDLALEVEEDRADHVLCFLAYLKGGRERVEFAVEGAFELICEGGNVYVSTADGQDIATRVIAPVIFTKIANRRARNPQLELMQYQMRLNQERFMAELAAENDRRMQAMERNLESYAERRSQGTPLANANRPSSGPSGEPSGDGGADAGDTPAAEAGAGGGKPAKPAKAAASGNDNAKGGKAAG